MNKEILIHIGTHKTGSTSIQDFLARNRRRLMEVNGIYFPKSGTLCSRTGHHNIAWEALASPRFRATLGTLEDLVNELSSTKFNLAVLSSEDFEFLVRTPEKLKIFDAYLCASGFSTRYVGFFRNTEDYANSLFFEVKKRGLERDSSEFLKKIKEKECVEYENGWHFDFNRERFISNWTAAIGEKFTCVDYDDAKKSLGVIPAFLELTGAGPAIIRSSRSAKRLNKTKKREKFRIHLANMLNAISSILLSRKNDEELL